MTQRSFALLSCVFVFVSAGVWATSARSQVVGQPGARSDASASENPPAPPAVAPGGGVGSDDPSVPMVAPGYAPDSAPPMPAHVAPGSLKVIRESIFGPASKEQWHPLSLSTFFSEGWDEPFVRSPEGTNGAPKQNWTGTADGIFVRFASVNFAFTDGMTTNSGLLLTPLLFPGPAILTSSEKRRPLNPSHGPGFRR